MDRPDSRASSNGGVNLNYTYDKPKAASRAPSPFPRPTTEYNAAPIIGGFSLHGVPARPTPPQRNSTASQQPPPPPPPRSFDTRFPMHGMPSHGPLISYPAPLTPMHGLPSRPPPGLNHSPFGQMQNQPNRAPPGHNAAPFNQMRGQPSRAPPGPYPAVPFNQQVYGTPNHAQLGLTPNPQYYQIHAAPPRAAPGLHPSQVNQTMFHARTPAQMAQHGRARPAPNEVARLICSGAVEVPDGKEDARRIRRNTSAAPADIAQQYYEPPRRLTGTSRATSVMMPQAQGSRGVTGETKPPNTRGNAVAFMNVQVRDPEFCIHLEAGFLPTTEEIFEFLPFIEPCRLAAPSNAGVVRITNIPYTSPRSEVAAFVGRKVTILSQPAGSSYHAVHVVMERQTGKTMDAFIEFRTAAEATSVLVEYQRRVAMGRRPKIGDREVSAVISSQEELMGELFPRAKNAYFVGSAPHVLKNQDEYFPEVPAAGFSGFLQNEEIIHMVKHAETPNRSPFAQRSFIRTYEAMISTLHKYPWFAHEHVLLHERLALFEAAYAALRALVVFTKRNQEDRIVDQTKPTLATLQELVVAVLTCPGFSEKEKHEVIVHLHDNGFEGMTSGRNVNMKLGGNSRIAAYWPFLVLARNPKHSDEYVEWVASLLKCATSLDKQTRSTGPHATPSLTEQNQQRSSGYHDGPFGNVQIDYRGATTIEEVGTIELQYVERMLSIVLPPPQQGWHFRP